MTNLDVNGAFGTLKAGLRERLVWRLSDHPILPQSWRQKLRKRFARPVTGPFDITHDGMKFRLYPAENYCDRILFGRHDLPERAEHEALIPFLRAGMVFVDIGANIGSYSVFVGTRLKGDVTLFALEPHPRTFQKLCFNLAANNLPTENVLNLGAGPAGELDLWSSGGSNIGNTSMLRAGTANAKESVKVHVRPLKDLLQQHNISHIDLLKIDVEGFEDRALAPFLDEADEQLLPSAILIEIAHQKLWERDLIAMLESRGYRETFRTAENRVLVR